MKTISVNTNESKAKRWMVLYTRSKWEKKADKLLKNEGFTSFCPLIKKKSMWSDRTKIVETPLFSSYLFVQVDIKEQSRVQQIPGIVSFVVHCNQPVVIDDLEIQRIHSILKVHTNVETVAINARHVGDRVTINSGPLANHEGEIMQLQGDSVLMIMEKLGCALVVKVDKSKLN